jgi:uncharacterized protein (TIGR03000 family)
MMWTMSRRCQNAFRCLLVLSVLSSPHVARGADKKPVLLDIVIPADAELEVNGYKTKSMGETRRFESPPVAEGKTYAYSLKVTWRGQSLTRRIVLEPDKLKTLDLRDELTALTAPKPKGSFAVLVPPSIAVTVGGSTPLPVRVKRFDFSEAIRVTLHNLPKGIMVSDALLSNGQTDVQTIVVAAADAGPGTWQVNVAAVSGDTRDSATIEITVVKPAPKVEPLPPPQLDAKDEVPTPPKQDKLLEKVVEATPTLELQLPNALELKVGQSGLMEVQMKTTDGTALSTAPTVKVDAGSVPLRVAPWTSSFKSNKAECTLGVALSVDKDCPPGEREVFVRVVAGRYKAERALKLTIKK